MIYKTAILLALALGGCASAEWVRPGSTSADLARDRAQCKYEAHSNTATIPGAQGGWEQGWLEVECLQSRGWRSVKK